jgi:hypothetical protein
MVADRIDIEYNTSTVSFLLLWQGCTVVTFSSSGLVTEVGEDY